MKSGLSYTRTVLMSFHILLPVLRMFQGCGNIITKVRHDQVVTAVSALDFQLK